MTFIIYLICYFIAGLVQSLLRLLLNNGSVSVIPGTLIIYGIATIIARNWVKSYKEKNSQENRDE